MNEALMVRGSQYGARGTFTPPTATQTGSQRVAYGDAPYFDVVHARQVFQGGNQAATAWSVALNTTHTGLVLSNPEGSSVDLIVIAAGFALSVAPAAIAHMSFFGGYLATGIVTHTTPLTARTTYLRGEQTAAQGKIDAAATLVGTPVWLMPFQGGFTAGALPGVALNLIWLNGLFILPPGAYFGIGALMAVTGFGSIVWQEVSNDTI